MSTKPTPKQPDAPVPDAAADAGELARLREEVAGMRARETEILDALLDGQKEIDALKAAQVGRAAAAVQQHDTEAELDAELQTLLAEQKALGGYGLIEVFERRALVGLDANVNIRLKGEPSVLEDPQGERCRWKLRWFNFGKEGRSHQATAEGYEKVAWDELAEQDAITGGTRQDQYVRKGERGLEVLHKIPRKLYEYKKRRDAARVSGLLTSESGLREHQANRVAAIVGAQGGNADQAGSFLASKKLSLTITPTETERFTP